MENTSKVKSLVRVLTLALTLISVGCGHSDEPAEGTSQVHFITFGAGVAGLVAKVKRPNLSVCLAGYGGTDRNTWKSNAESVILKWIEPLRKMTSDQLTTKVDVVDGSRRCDVDISIAPNTHSNTSISSYPTVRMSPTGYFASYNVLLHEFGHAFALSDTYQNGQSGNCRPGQPQAVMCNTSFSELQKDDVTGVQSIYKRLYPSDKPNEGGGSEELNAKISLALGKEASSDNFQIFAGLSGAAAAKNVAMAYCLKACEQEGSWTPIRYSDSRSEAYLFDMGNLSIQDAMSISVRAVNGAQKKYQTFEFKAI